MKTAMIAKIIIPTKTTPGLWFTPLQVSYHISDYKRGNTYSEQSGSESNSFSQEENDDKKKSSKSENAVRDDFEVRVVLLESNR